MLKFQMIFIAVLIACFAFISCDRAQQIMTPVTDDMMADSDSEKMDDGMMDDTMMDDGMMDDTMMDDDMMDDTMMDDGMMEEDMMDDGMMEEDMEEDMEDDA